MQPERRVEGKVGYHKDDDDDVLSVRHFGCLASLPNHESLSISASNPPSLGCCCIWKCLIRSARLHFWRRFYLLLRCYQSSSSQETTLPSQEDLAGDFRQKIGISLTFFLIHLH